MNVAPTPRPVSEGTCVKCLGLGQRRIKMGIVTYEWMRCSGCRGTGRKLRP